MAPEFTPSIVLIDLHFDNDVLMGKLAYYEKGEGRIGVRWGIEQQPDGYKSIGGGAAYIQNESLIEPPASQLRVRPVSDNRYQWSEGAREERKPPPMLIMILPKDYTAVNLVPSPIGTDIFTGISKEKDR